MRPEASSIETVTSVSFPPRSDLRAEAERRLLGKRAWLEKASFAHAGFSLEEERTREKKL